MNLLDMCATPQNKLAENKNVEYSHLEESRVCIGAIGFSFRLKMAVPSVVRIEYMWSRQCLRARATENLLTKT